MNDRFANEFQRIARLSKMSILSFETLSSTYASGDGSTGDVLLYPLGKVTKGILDQGSYRRSESRKDETKAGGNDNSKKVPIHLDLQRK